MQSLRRRKKLFLRMEESHHCTHPWTSRRAPKGNMHQPMNFLSRLTSPLSQQLMAPPQDDFPINTRVFNGQASASLLLPPCLSVPGFWMLHGLLIFLHLPPVPSSCCACACERLCECIVFAAFAPTPHIQTPSYSQHRSMKPVP